MKKSPGLLVVFILILAVIGWRQNQLFRGQLAEAHSRLAQLELIKHENDRLLHRRASDASQMEALRQQAREIHPLRGQVAELYRLRAEAERLRRQLAEKEIQLETVQSKLEQSEHDRASAHTNVLSAQFSPDGKLIVTGNADGTTRLWDTATGRSLNLPLQTETGKP